MLKMLKIKIFNSGSEYDVTADLISNECIWKRICGRETIVDAILDRKDAKSVISWIRNRIGGVSIADAIEIIQHNNARSVKDFTTIEIIEVKY